jgi:hypothetical protein
MRILDLREELDRIADSVDAKLQSVYVPRAERHRWIAIRGKRPETRETEVGFVLALAQHPRGGCQQQQKLY